MEGEKLLKEIKDEFKRYTGVLKEYFNDQVKIVTEQYQDIKKTLDSHTEMIGSMKEDIEVIKIKLHYGAK